MRTKLKPAQEQFMRRIASQGSAEIDWNNATARSLIGLQFVEADDTVKALLAPKMVLRIAEAGRVWLDAKPPDASGGAVESTQGE